MKSQHEVEQLIADATPHDGFQVKDIVVGDEHSLHLVFYANGIPANPPWLIGSDAKPYKEVWCKRVAWLYGLNRRFAHSS